MDTFVAIASKRDWKRGFADRRIEEDVERRILDAGRLAGSAMNRQPWRFLVVEDRALRERLAETVFVPANVLGAPLVVALVGPPGELPAFDAGRAAQNMFLAAWNEGVASVPNGMPDRERTGQVLGVRGDEIVRIVLAFGYPARPADPERRPPAAWSAAANRRALDELVERR
ncbi:MAG: nitroreductase family protein [Actinomycetota bacterium]|nr:nitroreductase family protein [Actinomycetota bacterium]